MKCFANARGIIALLMPDSLTGEEGPHWPQSLWDEDKAAAAHAAAVAAAEHETGEGHTAVRRQELVSCSRCWATRLCMPDCRSALLMYAHWHLLAAAADLDCHILQRGLAFATGKLSWQSAASCSPRVMACRSHACIKGMICEASCEWCSINPAASHHGQCSTAATSMKD